MAGSDLPSPEGGPDTGASPGTIAAGGTAPHAGTPPHAATPTGAAISGADALGFAETPKQGGLGGIIGAILRGLQPAVRRTTRRVRVRRGNRGAGTSAASRGALLQLRYHAGRSASWETTRVAFGRRGNRIAVISSSDASWWRHVRSGTPVQVRIRNQWVDGRARLLSRDEDTYARAVGIFIEDRSRAAAQRLGVPMDEQGRLVHGPRRPGDAVVVWIEIDAAD